MKVLHRNNNNNIQTPTPTYTPPHPRPLTHPHPPPQYVRENIPSLLTNNYADFEEHFVGCDCTSDQCNSTTCECIRRSGDTRNYTDTGLLISPQGLEFTLLISQQGL